MAINDFMAIAANALRDAVLYGQLHSGSAGGDGLANVTAAARQAVSWTAPGDMGSFSLAAPIQFTGGTPDSPVFSVSLWSAATDGVFYREILLSGGSDTTFDSGGVFTVTVLQFTGLVT